MRVNFVLATISVLPTALTGPPPTHFLFAPPGSRNSLSVCICAKCGSTSVFRALHHAIVGKEKPAGPPWIQAFMKWRAPGVSASGIRGSVHVHITRDPIDRYVSAFHSKLRCCPGSCRSCHPDMAWKSGRILAAELLRLASNQTIEGCARCLHMADYARALRTVHRAGRQRRLNSHFLPQHLACGGTHGPQEHRATVADGDAAHLAAAAARAAANNYRIPLVLRGNVSTLASALMELRGFHFKGGHLKLEKAHETARTDGSYEVTPEALSDLCEVSRAEYRALRMRAPKECDQAGPAPSSGNDFSSTGENNTLDSISPTSATGHRMRQQQHIGNAALLEKRNALRHS